MLTLKRKGIAEKDSKVQLSYKETYFLYEGTVVAKNGETLKECISKRQTLDGDFDHI